MFFWGSCYNFAVNFQSTAQHVTLLEISIMKEIYSIKFNNVPMSKL